LASFTIQEAWECSDDPEAWELRLVTWLGRAAARDWLGRAAVQDATDETRRGEAEVEEPSVAAA